MVSVSSCFIIYRTMTVDSANCAVISPEHHYQWIDQGCSAYQTAEPICEKRYLLMLHAKKSNTNMIRHIEAQKR